MILITGGSGFIGSHTVRALLEIGESCVLVQRAESAPSAVLAGLPLAMERADVTDLAGLLEVGERHDITGIVHLAGSMPWPPGADHPIEATRRAIGGLLNVFEAAERWRVRRVGVASTIGVYAGLDVVGPLREDLPLLMTASHLIPTFKKVGKLLGGHLSGETGIEIVDYRISGTWGPLGKPDPFFAAPALVHAAVRGTTPDLSRMVGPAHLEDALDLCYVKDTGRAIALLQTAERLHHRTYNVASGRATSNAEVGSAIRKVIPEARIDLPVGGGGARSHLDIHRLEQDTGYRPEYDVERAAADYLAWLRAGNER